jgi:dihydropteroate synthase
MRMPGPPSAGSAAAFRCRRFTLPLGGQALVVGVVNVTPDSFSDGGRYLNPGAACDRAHALAAEGADIVEVGGESSRPGARPVPAAEELRRVLPVVRRLTRELPIPVAVDTWKAPVAEAVLDAGADLLNDITALAGGPALAAAAGRAGAGLILMHMRGTPETMQQDPAYADVVGEVRAALGAAAARAEAEGVAPDSIAVDPGLGFGKTVRHNLELLGRLGELCAMGRPVMVGASRKAFLGAVLEAPLEERLEGTLAAGAAAILQGASLVRVHDVRPMVRVARVLAAIARGAP